jgi:Flp pilus assembly protein TadD
MPGGIGNPSGLTVGLDSSSAADRNRDAARGSNSSLGETLTAPHTPKGVQLLARAETQYNAGQLTAAITTLRRLREVELHCTAGLSLEAQIALDRGDRAGCALAAQAVSAAHPESPDIQLRAGNLLVQLGEQRGGLLALERAYRLSPYDPRTARSLAAAYIEIRNFPAAESVLKSALLRTPGDDSLSITLARLSETEQRWSHAVFYYDLVFDSRLNDPDWLARRAHSLYQAGQFDRAFSDFELCESDLLERGDWHSVGEFADTCWQLGHDDLARHLRDQIPQPLSPPRPIAVEQLATPAVERVQLANSNSGPRSALRRLESLLTNH